MSPEAHTTTTTATNAMSPDEVARFLAEPHLGRLATVRPDGFPHVSPIWFFWAGDHARFILGETRRHIRNLELNPRASLCVDVDFRTGRRFADGAQAVIITGTVAFSDDMGLLAQTYADQAQKYIGDWQSDPDYIAGRDAEVRRLCLLSPTRTVSWDFRKAPQPEQR